MLQVIGTHLTLYTRNPSAAHSFHVPSDILHILYTAADTLHVGIYYILSVLQEEARARAAAAAKAKAEQEKKRAEELKRKQAEAAKAAARAKQGTGTTSRPGTQSVKQGTARVGTQV